MRKFVFRFIINLITPLLLIYIICILTFFIFLPKISSYDNIDEFNLNPNHKIIFIGSSNLSYNYNYDAIKNAFPKYDIYLIGKDAHQGIGISLLTLKNLKTTDNDILFFALPHSHYLPKYLVPFGNKYVKNLHSQELLLEYRYVIFAYTNIFQITKSLFYQIIKPVSLNKPIFPLRIVNTNNAEKHKSQIRKSTEEFKQWYSVDIRDPNTYYLNWLKHNLSGLNGNKLFWYTPLMQNQFQLNQKFIPKTESTFYFLNSFSESIYTSELFYDKRYHLNEKGRRINTRKVITQLKKITNEPTGTLKPTTRGL